jgi:hypothetical protein
MNSTFRGIAIALKEDSENAHDPIRFNSQSDSNEMDKSDLQREKENESRLSTRRGILIDCRDDPLNAFDSIRFNWEWPSKLIAESD